MNSDHNDYSEFESEYETPIQTRTDEQKKRDYLTSRLEDVYSIKRQETRKMFHMDAIQPDTIAEFIERIQAGKFTPPDEKLGNGSSYNIWSIDWHDPATPADEAGYLADRAAFKKLMTATLDTIKIADPADGLKALQALEAWTPTGAAN